MSTIKSRYVGCIWFVLFTVVLIAGVLPSLSEAQQFITPPGMLIDFQQRELQASPQIKAQLQNLRQQIKSQNLTFQVGYTTALDFPIGRITGFVVPKNLPQLAQEQNVRATELLKQMPILEAPACSTAINSFDWRQAKGATGVRDQGPCGSCWDFATHGAFEGNYYITTGVAIDSSEQDTLDCNPWGYGCNGGLWAFDYLINKGSAREADYPYVARKGTCKNNVARPYKAVAWGYVNEYGGIPDVTATKEALCRHGPLAVAVLVTSAFQAYTGGVFNEKAIGKTNHGVTLIGWDDSKQAWLIKNSWGTGWGETGGYGPERGYMWIAYTSNSVGYAAAWGQAESSVTDISWFIPIMFLITK